MWNQRPSYRFEIDNFSEKKALISSKTFVSGGCEWYLQINPKGDRISDGHLPLYLYVANSTTLRTGWKRSANYYFVLLNQSDKELHRSPISLSTNLFCAKTPAWGFAKTIPVSKFQGKGFLEKDRLIIEVHIKVIEAFDGEGGDVSNNKKKKTVDINGFQVFASQVTKVGKIFTEHPDIALDFKPTKQEVKTAYMNVLLRVIKTLNKPPKSLSETRLNKASSELSELMDVGFKLDWLKSKLEEVSLERKKPDVDGYQLSDDDNESRAQQVEERVKDLELKLDEVSFGRKLSDDDNESRAQQVEERVKNLELKLDEISLGRKKGDDTNESRAQQVEERVEDLELKLDEVSFERKLTDDDNESRAQQVEERVKNLELKLDEVSLGRKKADDTNEFRAKQVEKRVKNLELMELELNKCWKPKLDELEGKKTDDAIIFEQIEDRVMGIEFKLDSLNTKLEEISKETEKAGDADGSLVQQLEESVKNIELMVSHLKDELDKKKNIASDDGFLLGKVWIDMSNRKPSFRFEIDNFSEKKANAISSNTFKSGGCEWFLAVYPKGDRLADGHLSLYLQVANDTTLQPGWKRSINFYVVLLNQSGKELYKTGLGQSSFCAENPAWGYRKTLPLSKFQEEGFLEKDKLIIEVYINGGEVEDVSNKKKTVDINGFQVFASQVTKVGKIFTEHPDIAKDFKPTKQEVKTAYMNVLLRVIKTLNKPPKSLSETRLNKASSELSELMNVGFKLDWLKLKLDEVTLERKKPDADGSKVQQLEERVKHLELKLDEVNESRTQQVEERVKKLELKLHQASFSNKSLSDDANEYRAQQLEERVTNLEMMEVGLKLDSLNTKLDEVSLERKKTDDTNESRAQQVEKRVKNLMLMELRLNTMLGNLEREKSYDTSVFDSRIQQMEKHVMGLGLKLESLITKLEDISQEKKKADDADGSLVQKHEESLKNIELMVSHLKVEVDKKKNIASDDGFLLVD
ncbi:unnamed protein product [Brassica rapa subsp. trilocularis]